MSFKCQNKLFYNMLTHFAILLYLMYLNTAGSTTTVAPSSDVCGGLSALLAGPVVQLIMLRGRHSAGRTTSCCSRIARIFGHRRSRPSAPARATCGDSVDALMGRGRVSGSDFIGVTDYHAFFDEKVAGVRATTADADPATYTPAPPGCSLSAFQLLTTSDVISAVKLLPDKQCSADPMPTWLLKDCVYDLAPFLCYMFNTSLQHGIVPSTFKSAFITSHRCSRSQISTRLT